VLSGHLMANTVSETDTSRATAPATPELLALYRRAFATYRARALWNIREFSAPSSEDVLAIARPLRTEGDMEARRLAEQIEQVARAAV
jgi:hypothetical protein